MRCDDLRSIAPDLAIDELTGAERAEALAHLATCDGCRSLVAELAAIADSLLLLAPASEPPSGFETRVLGRAGIETPRRRVRWRRRALLVAAAAAVGVMGGVLLASAGDGGSLPVAAAFHNRDGDVTGTVVLADDPDRMTCTFEDPRFGGRYAVEVVLEGGAVTGVGAFTSEGVPWSWTVELPVDASDVREVVVRSDDGTIRATAKVTD